jgi:2-methylisocitrate lyase-like PEP mutase family enzyme
MSTDTNRHSTASLATELLRLHTDPELLVMVNVWDVVGATVVADQPGCRALATASHSIAATFGYPDGEKIPRDLMIDMCGRIAAAVDVPVSADLESGYGDPGETIRRAIGVGVVGANLEDAMRPMDESVAAVEAAVAAAIAEGVPDFVLNARTDAFLRGADRDPADVLQDAIARGRAYVEAGAPVVFVPGKLSMEVVNALVEGIGERRVTTIGSPGANPIAALQEAGVARVSYGPWTQRLALTHLADAAADLLAGSPLPEGIRVLN